MNSIQPQTASSGITGQYPAMPDSENTRTFMEKQSLSQYEQLNAGLTIKTKQGDLVTLNSSSFSKMDACQYSSSKIMSAENKMAVETINYREITLASGESFSFSVAGDLNEEELEDIEQIVSQIDEIIEEMIQGDMKGAVEKALEMDGYETVSMFTADISLQRGYRAQTQTAQQQSSALAGQQPSNSHRGLDAYMKQMQVKDIFEKPGYNETDHFEKYIEKMTQQLDRHSELQAKRSQKVVSKLFDHHLKNYESKFSNEIPSYRSLRNAADRVNQYIENLFNSIFEEQFI